MFYLLSFFWFIRETKAILFWLYLWQLKEYHTGRFLDHFRTTKGKNLFLNLSYFLKLILFSYALILSQYPKLLNWQFYATWIIILVIIYFFESGKFFLDIFQKKIKTPVLTQKTIFLILVNLIFVILFLYLLYQRIKIFYWFSFALLSFDFLTPFIVSGIVLCFQPLTVYLRNKIIKRAKDKRLQSSLRPPRLMSGPLAKFKDLIVIGITGSYGKTSTKEFLATILAEKYKVLKTKEHQNSEVGVSLCILNELQPEHEVFVVEMGAYNRGGIKLLCDIVKPKIGILTGINEQHLSTFGSMENLLSAEGGKELIESLPEDGMVFFNGKNKYCRDLYQKTKIKKYLYGENANLLLENIEGAKAVARELGMSEEEISRACQKIENKLPGIEVKKGINNLNIIDATYSANPDGVISHLEYLKIWPDKKIIVMPCLIELGKASKEVHKRIGQKIGEVCDLAIITTKERFKEIKDGAMEKGMGEEDVLFEKDPKKILELIKISTKPGDIILLEGRVPKEVIKLG